MNKDEKPKVGDLVKVCFFRTNNKFQNKIYPNSSIGLICDLNVGKYELMKIFLNNKFLNLDPLRISNKTYDPYLEIL